METIPQKELRNNVGEVLRRAEAGEQFTITVAGRPVAQLGPAARRTWVAGPQLDQVWATPAPGSLAEDLERFPAELADPHLQVRVVLDTSVLIGSEHPGDVEGAISVATLAELHFGVLVASDDGERALRSQRLGVVESAFEPLPIDAAVAREWGRLSAAVTTRGGQPRRRAIDLAIAATANVHGVPLVTRDAADMAIIDDLVAVRALQRPR